VLAVVPLVALAVQLALASQASADRRPPHAQLCTIKGTKGDDRLRGTPGRDVICAYSGDDTIDALGGNDFVFGQAGNDRIDGGPGRDHLFGGIGADRLRGGSGPDYLYAAKGRDRLDGGSGADALYGDLGGDRLRGDSADFISGGPGNDVGDPYDASNVADCPTTDRVCEIHIHLDVSLYCPSYAKSTGACVGRTPYANPAWAVYVSDLPVLFAGFSWWDGGYGPDHWYKETQYGTSPLIAKIEGKVPYHSSPNYAVDNAYTFGWPYGTNITWNTPQKPGVPAGKDGGPLYLNFVNGYIGADMYIDGFLYRK
jgi:Ca2+-binding RTX toxin-like protein